LESWSLSETLDFIIQTGFIIATGLVLGIALFFTIGLVGFSTEEMVVRPLIVKYRYCMDKPPGPPFWLLDLPTELVDLVMNEYMEDAGFENMWRARQTCSK
jgi:hypothetical protein